MTEEILSTIEEKLDPRHTAVLVVDVQNDFAHPDGYGGKAGADLTTAQAAADKLVDFVAEARRLGIQVIHVRAHYDDKFTGGPMLDKLNRRRGPSERCIAGTWGADFYKVIPEDGEHVINKHRYSGFVGTDLEMILHKNGIKTLITGGLTTGVCVESTVRDAFHRDFYNIMLSDGTASPTPDSHQQSLDVMGSMFAEVMPINEVVNILKSAAVPAR